jgi:hypothetical protein
VRIAASIIMGAAVVVTAVFLVRPTRLAADDPGEITIARLRYGGGGDWYNDPSIIPNLSQAIEQRTGIPVSEREAVVSASDPELFQSPFVFMTGHGNVRFSDREVVRLRSWFEAGGFLYADDDYGMDESFRREMKRIFPDAELTELPLDFPLYRVPYRFDEGLPKIHEHDGKPPQGFGIFLDGRLAVYYTYETNISDGWADADVHGDPEEKREEALRMGVNIFVYALTH